MNATKENPGSVGCLRGSGERFLPMPTSKHHSTVWNSPLERAKALITVIDAWTRLGMPGTPKVGSCKSPLRADNNPSFHVHKDGARWTDYGTGDHGDVIDFISAATGQSKSDAAKTLIGWAGTAPITHAGGHSLPFAAPRQPRESGHVRALPALVKPTLADLETITAQRRLPTRTAGLEKAIRRGLLWAADVWDFDRLHRCWVLTDMSRRNAQARKMDGSSFVGKDGTCCYKAKAMIGPGYAWNWPIGAADIGDAPNVILTEGTPDLLAAITIAQFVRDGAIEDLAFACMTGAGATINDDALPLFSGKTVRIVPHQDEKGQGEAAFRRWASALHKAGAHVERFGLEDLKRPGGAEVNDLNDACFFAVEDGDNETRFRSDIAELVNFAVGAEVAS